MLFCNEHFTLPPDNREFVLLGTGDNGKIALIIDKYDKKALPQAKPMQWVLDHAKPVATQEQEKALTVASQCATEAGRRKADERWSLIKEIVANPALYFEGSRWDLIQAHAAAKKCSPNTLLAALRLYWQGGQTRDALLGYRMNRKSIRNDKNEENEETTPTQPCRRGRPATKAGCVNYYASKVDHANFRQVIDDYFLKDDRVSFSAAHEYLCWKHYFYRDGNGALNVRPAGERPTRRQFIHFLKKHYPLEYRLRCRKGDKAFERDHRPVLGTVDDVCMGVGHIYEMDATIADVTIVSSLRRSDIIGRPSIYIIIDRSSRLIVGWYVGLETPCWPAALQAIFSIAEDKQALCQRLGIEYDLGDWPATGILSQQLYVDRGESRTREAEALARTQTTVTNLPSCRPDWKPIVEQQFRLTHKSIADLPGYNPASNAVKRRSKDYSQHAVLTLQEFESILVKCFITHNKRVMKSFQMTREQIAARVQPSPIALFKHGLVTRSGQLPRYMQDTLRLALLPNDEATVDEHGIHVNGMCYRPENDVRRAWFVEGRKAVGEVKVSFDRRRVDMIYVHDKDAPGGYFMANLSRHSIKYAGMSLQEAVLVQKEEEILHAQAEQSRLQTRGELRQHSEAIVANAKLEAKLASQGVSKTGRRTNAKAGRVQELNIERDELAMRAQSGLLAGVVPPQLLTCPTNVTRLPTREVPANMNAARKARQQLFDQSIPL